MAETLKKAAVQKIRGLVSIELCELVNGAIPTDPEWFEIGQTVPDSCVITRGEATKVEEYIEEVDDPTDSFVTQKAVRTVSWQSRNYHGEVLEKVLGGTYDETLKVWKEPSVDPEKEFAIRLTSKNGVKPAIDRAKIEITENTQLAKSASAALSFVARQVSSGSTTTSGFSITFPTT